MFKTNINLSQFDLNKIRSIAESIKKKNINVQTTNIFSEEIIEIIMKNIKQKLQLDDIETAWILVTGVLQKGGSNQKAGNAISFTVGEKSLTSHELQKFIKEVIKNGTNRQLAKSIADDVAKIALEFNIPGDLHAQMKFEFPNLSDSDAVWCSNFQTTNPRCPESVRNWLISNYRSRFNK